MDAWSLLQRRLRGDAGAPLVTFIDADEARVELSATSVANAAAKIANALRDELDLDEGAVVALDLPIHWQRTVWLAGVWTAGCALMAPAAWAASAVITDGTGADLTITTAARASEHSGPVAVVSLHPFGLPDGVALPPGAIDATELVRQQPDALMIAPPTGAELAVDEPPLTQDALLAHATEIAEGLGLAAGGRLLVPADAPDNLAWMCALAVPLAAGASAVLVAPGVDTSRVVAQERVTATAGV